MTQKGYDKLVADLEDLKTRGRAEAAAAIAEARDKGDLSENAEYDAAKDAQGLLELRISQLQNKVANARIIDESALDPNKVSILATVKLRNVQNKMELSYTIVSEEEADLKKAKISAKSPIAAGLLGKKVGETAKIKIPAGELELEVLEIKYDL